MFYQFPLIPKCKQFLRICLAVGSNLHANNAESVPSRSHEYIFMLLWVKTEDSLFFTVDWFYEDRGWNVPPPTTHPSVTVTQRTYCILIVRDMNTPILTYIHTRTLTHTEDIIFLTLQVSESCMRHSQQLQWHQTVEQALWDLSDFVSV